MTRLIDADALDYLTHRECVGHGEYYDMEIVTKVRIDNAPTIDIAEVCGECKPYEPCIYCIHEFENMFETCGERDEE